MTLALDPAHAVVIIDECRERGIHNRDTPEDDAGKLELAEKLVSTARNVYADGKGNTGETVMTILRLAGYTIREDGTLDEAVEEAGAEADAPAPEPGPPPEAEAPAGGEGDGAPDGEGGTAGSPDAPPGDEAPAAGGAGGDQGPPAGGAEPAGGEGGDAQDEPGAEAPEPPRQVAADEAPAGEEAGGAEGDGSHGLKSLPRNLRQRTVEILERAAQMGLPVSNAMEGDPEVLPRDITAVDGQKLRQLYWERHSLRTYTRFRIALIESDASDVKRILNARTMEGVAELRGKEEYKDLSMTELKSNVVSNSTELTALADELAEKEAEAAVLHSLLSWFQDDVEALSRETSARAYDRGAPGPETRR